MDFAFQYHKQLDFREQFFIFSELQVYVQNSSHTCHSLILETQPLETDSSLACITADLIIMPEDNLVISKHVVGSKNESSVNSCLYASLADSPQG
jgi:hypothetical protein